MTRKTFERGELIGACPACFGPVRSLPIDEGEERVLVDRKSIHVAIRIPDLVGYLTTQAYLIHRCPSRRIRKRVK